MSRWCSSGSSRDRVERLALVSSGGLGPEVSPLLRSIALPGASALVSLAGHDVVTGGLDRAGARAAGARLMGGRTAAGDLAGAAPARRPGARRAFVQSLRAVIDARGQRVSATDRLYLLENVPTLIAWGERDHTIPIEHGRAAHAALPHSRFVTIPGAAHFPHLEAPAELAAALEEFIASTEPARLDEAAWRELLQRRSAARRRPRAA